MKLRMSGKDIVLLTLSLTLGGVGTSHAIISLIKTHLKRHYRDTYHHHFNEKTFRATLSRLKKQGFLTQESRGAWRITKQGERLTATLARYIGYETWKRKKTDARVLVIFDIPELQRKKRDRLRIELLSLDFKPLQKSAWIGKGPLPHAFLEYLRELNLLSHVHILAVQKPGTISS